MSGRLVVAYPGVLAPDAHGAMEFDEKLRSGLACFQERWPGEVVLAAAERQQVTMPRAGTSRVRREDLPVALVTAPTWAEAVRRATPDLLLAPLIDRVAELEPWLDRTVLTAEFTPTDLRAHELSSAPGATARARVRVGSRRRATRFAAWARRARGVQCNGYPAYDHFSALSPQPLLFFDTRLSAEHVAGARAARRERPHQPAQLCFSGRVIAAKGADAAVSVAGRLGPEVALSVLGRGDLTATLQREAGGNVSFLEGLPFATDWVRFVRDEVDLMVLPHRQGDPSGTYLEAAGLGVPVVGFANVALSALVEREGLGWVVPLDDDAALARRVVEVLANPAGWRAAGDRGMAFMAEHHSDAEFDRRVEHLLHCR